MPRKRRVSAVKDSEVIYVKHDIFQKCKPGNLVFKDKEDKGRLTSLDLLDVEKIKYMLLREVN